MNANATLAHSYRTVHDVLEALVEGICVSPYSRTLSVLCATGTSSEAEKFDSSSESDDPVLSLNIGLDQRVSKPWSNTSDKEGGGQGNGKMGIILPSLSFYASHPACCNLQPFSHACRRY